MLIAAISSGPALAEVGGEKPEGPSIMAGSVIYKVSRTPPDDFLNCLYRDQIKLLCPPDVEFVSVEKQYKTKDYDLLVASMGHLGTGNRWHDWKLIVEDGKKAIIMPLAEECLECDIRVEKLNFQSNEIVFTHRQAKQLQTATFRAGRFTLRKSKLDPQEPLDEETCGYLFGGYEYCSKAERDTVDCSMAQANSGHFALLRIEDQYAGISYEGMQRMCRAACSSGKAMDRATFFRKVCRR